MNQLEKYLDVLTEVLNLDGRKETSKVLERNRLYYAEVIAKMINNCRLLDPLIEHIKGNITLSDHPYLFLPDHIENFCNSNVLEGELCKRFLITSQSNPNDAVAIFNESKDQHCLLYIIGNIVHMFILETI